MSITTETNIGLTVGDNGVTISGTFTQKDLGALADMSGCSASFSLLRVGGGAPIVNNAAATIGAFNQGASSVVLSYRLQAADVAAAVDLAKVRWTITLPDGSKINGPGPLMPQTYVKIAA
jgi:hypothetical protein